MKEHYFQMVYDVVRLIPPGRICTYGLIADFLGLGSARMVGWALNKCISYGTDIPAHRVVNRKGELSGRNHFPGSEMMQQLLENEGIVVEMDKVRDFDKLLWKPQESQNTGL